jgi:DNA-binding NtrC family response regulator
MKKTHITVLFVDDEKEFLEIIVKRMKKRGISVHSVESGDDAISFLSSIQADIVVMDFQMPGMNGLETLIKIRQRHPLVEVIMLTGYACMDAASKGLEAGAFDYLVKPVDIDELFFKIEDAYHKISIHRKKMKRLENSITLKKSNPIAKTIIKNYGER